MIDIEKFICSLLADHPEGVTVRGDIHRALKEQGLEYKDGKIVPIEDKTELKESEDERVRKELIEFLDEIWHLGKNANFDKWDKADCSNWLAWLEKQGNETPCDRCKKSQPSHSCQDITELGRCYLEHEKQGEQKPSEWSEEDENGLGDALWAIKQARTVAKDENDMGTLWYAERWLKSIKDRIQSKQSSKPQGKTALEAIEEEKVDKPFDYENANIVQKDFVPKFEFGDWIVQENIGVYQVIQVCESWYEAVDNKGKGYSIGFDKEHMLRLWTINDAQDGDVLVASDGSIFIFAGVVDCACKYYITLTATNDVKINKEEKGGYWETSRAVHPATKEQCALLFQKMREEGYEWDSEKKKLIKIE